MKANKQTKLTKLKQNQKHIQKSMEPTVFWSTTPGMGPALESLICPVSFHGED